MSALYNRTYRLEIDGEGQTTIISGLRMTFVSTKTRATTANEMTITVYNPNDTTVKQSLSTKANVRLYAGYGFDLPLIAQSQITTAKTEKTLTDLILTIEAMDGVADINRAKVSLSFERGAKAKQVIDAIQKALGVPLRISKDVDLNAPFNNGYAYVGGVAKALDEVCARVGAKWTMQNGDLLILGESGSSDLDAVFLSPYSGMIGSPTPTEDSTNSLTVGEVKRGWKVVSLLQGNINPSDKIIIESKGVKGTFIVDKVTHKGDTMSKEWYSEMEVLDGI
jgi:hypothetical protein